MPLREFDGFFEVDISNEVMPFNLYMYMEIWKYEHWRGICSVSFGYIK